MYQVSFNWLASFRDMLRTSFLLQKLKKGSNSINTVDRVTILALYTSVDGPLSIYQVSFKTLVYFQKYAPDKVFIAKLRKEVTPLQLLTG